MRKNHTRLIVDTETAGTLKTPLVYNLAYTIVDKDDKIILQRDYVISEIFDNEEVFATAYYKDKYPFYKAMLASGNMVKTTFAKAINQMKRDIEMYDSLIFAYNAPFDFKAISHTAETLGVYNPLETMFFIDIMNFIAPITNTREYANFCISNRYYTKTGLLSKTAENVYRFLKNDTDFNEAHTALADTMIEFEVLNSVLRSDI